MTKTKKNRMEGRKVKFSSFNQFRERGVNERVKNPFNVLVS